MYEIEGLISFYPHFRTRPPVRVDVAVCHDLSCWLNGADAALAAIRAGHGHDAAIELREVSCIGRCELAPAISVNEVPATASALENLLVSGRGDAPAGPSSSPSSHRWPNDPYDAGEERYRVLRRALLGELSPSQIVGEVRESGLRGMGGAGFPTAQKWQLVADQVAGPKYVICNADESEPGTFKDRQILADEPHLVLEGLLLGMVVTGAEQGWVFIRHEYGPEEAILRAELERIRAEGLIGVDALGTGRRLEVDVFTSPGGYVLGEESALLECLEGHRGEPRNKPPFPGTSGLWGRPTLINNVETFADVPIIVERGRDLVARTGGERGRRLEVLRRLRSCRASGRLLRAARNKDRRPSERGGRRAQRRTARSGATGGASSNFLAADQLDVPLDFESVARAGSMLGSGALVVVAEGTDLLAAATNVLRFFRNESCGKCVPCRVGSAKAHTILTAALAKGAPRASSTAKWSSSRRRCDSPRSAGSVRWRSVRS